MGPTSEGKRMGMGMGGVRERATCRSAGAASICMGRVGLEISSWALFSSP